MKIGTKVIIRKGFHDLLVGSIGTILSTSSKASMYFEVIGEHKNGSGRTIENLLKTTEFKVQKENDKPK